MTAGLHPRQSPDEGPRSSQAPILRGFAEAAHHLPSYVSWLTTALARGSHHVLHHTCHHLRHHPWHGPGSDGHEKTSCQDTKKGNDHVPQILRTGPTHLDSSLLLAAATPLTCGSPSAFGRSSLRCSRTGSQFRTQQLVSSGRKPMSGPHRRAQRAMPRCHQQIDDPNPDTGQAPCNGG